MWKLQVSPRTLKAAEKYIASLGRKREELTEEQWNLMVRYVEGRRIAIPFLLMMCLLLAGMTFVNWHRGHKYFTKAIPNNTVTISFEDKSEPISLSPKEVRDYFDYTIHLYMMAWGGFLVATMLLTILICFGIIGQPGHKILLSRPTTTGPVI
jgi:hypothetical protein